MEFSDLSRYYDISEPHIPLFSTLRGMKPVLMTQDLTIVEEEENLDYSRMLAKKGITLVPIRRIPPSSSYIDRETFPRRILAEMTSRCNFSCRMCPQQNLKRPKIDMDPELYCRLIDEVDHYGVEGFWIYHLGEPLMHHDFSRIVGHINSKKNLGVIWMSTNGELLTEEHISLILNSKIDYVNYSAHAISEKAYQTITNNDAFNCVQNNLSLFYEMKGTENLPKKPFLHVQMIEQETTRHKVDGFIRRHYNKADIVSINMLEYVNLPNNLFGMEQRKREPLTSCTRVSRNDCFVCSNGWVTLCDAAYNGEIMLGDINKSTLHDIWNGGERRRILKLNSEGRMNEIEFCQTCTDYDI